MLAAARVARRAAFSVSAKNGGKPRKFSNLRGFTLSRVTQVTIDAATQDVVRSVPMVSVPRVLSRDQRLTRRTRRIR
ncbi:hypothetical protein DF156_15395 [Burkholderia ubonensis]|nr:hypothetical protein DF155_14085 [Burkholderia ubonensis]RQP37296.1 hypothetical protein DF154_19425 [Burkholderia ubonensis]RQP40906.1 hypothetical protein DF156_15395 [Burkholderia ubonensis]RQP54302.1 hypothetical protein DF144_15290 [Burkholderia ubonensis]RQP56371.1 hypothetical protein DF159_24075 [Burkholderia ubonensis]